MTTNVPETNEVDDAALAGDQPSRARHQRHGRDRALLPRHARRAARRDDRHSRLPALLLRVRPAEHGRVLRVRGLADGAVREAGGHPRRARAAVRPSLVQSSRRAGAARPPPAPEERRLRGHRRRRPRLHPARSTSPTPTASRSRRRTGCSTRPAARPTSATATCSPIRTRCPRCASCRPSGALASVPDDPPRLVQLV